MEGAGAERGDWGRRPGYGGSSNFGYGDRGPGSYGRGGTGESAFDRDRPGFRQSFGHGPQSQRGPFTGRGPKGYRRSDERIREDVCERLSDNDEVDASEIEVQVKDRKVTLTGSVQNRRMKHIAEDLAEAVSGVDDVDNRITVTKPFLKDMVDRVTGNEGEQHYAHSGTKNGAGAGVSGSSTSGLQSASNKL